MIFLDNIGGSDVRMVFCGQHRGDGGIGTAFGRRHRGVGMISRRRPGGTVVVKIGEML